MARHGIRKTLTSKVSSRITYFKLFNILDILPDTALKFL